MMITSAYTKYSVMMITSAYTKYSVMMITSAYTKYSVMMITSIYQILLKEIFALTFQKTVERSCLNTAITATINGIKVMTTTACIIDFSFDQSENSIKIKKQSIAVRQ